MSRTFRKSDIFEFTEERHNRSAKVDKKHLRMKVPDGKVQSPVFDAFTNDGDGFLGYGEEFCHKKLYKKLRNKKKRHQKVDEE